MNSNEEFLFERWGPRLASLDELIDLDVRCVVADIFLVVKLASLAGVLALSRALLYRHWGHVEIRALLLGCLARYKI